MNAKTGVAELKMEKEMNGVLLNDVKLKVDEPTTEDGVYQQNFHSTLIRKISSILPVPQDPVEQGLKVLGRYYQHKQSQTQPPPDTWRPSNKKEKQFLTVSLPPAQPPGILQLAAGDWVGQLMKSGRKRWHGGRLWVFRKFIAQDGVRHVLLVIVLILYALVGAAIFNSIEKPAEDLERAAAKAEAGQRWSRYVARVRWLLDNDSDTDPYHRTLSLSNLSRIFEDYDLETGLSAMSEKRLNSWDFWNAVFYATTTFTTIGYGNMVCKTLTGRMATVVYAFFGIPLMLVMLHDLGQFIMRCLQICWKKLKIFLRQRKRLFHKPLQDQQQQQQPTLLFESSTEDDFPLILAALIIFAYIIFCSCIFLPWFSDQKWDFWTSFYFVVISMSTIGFGDVVPNNPKDTIPAFFAFLLGLALVSMCVNMIQRKVEAKYMTALELMEAVYVAKYRSVLRKRQGNKKTTDRNRKSGVSICPPGIRRHQTIQNMLECLSIDSPETENEWRSRAQSDVSSRTATSARNSNDTLARLTVPQEI